MSVPSTGARMLPLPTRPLPAAGARRNGVHERAGRRRDMGAVAKQRQAGSRIGRVRGDTAGVGEQIAAFTEMAEPDRLTQCGQGVERIIERRHLMADALDLGVGLQHRLVGWIRHHIG